METKPQETYISPSKITQYFDSKKSRRGKGELKKGQESTDDVPDASFVYLTPESSPQSVINENHDKHSDDLIESSEIIFSIKDKISSEFSLQDENALDVKIDSNTEKVECKEAEEKESNSMCLIEKKNSSVGESETKPVKSHAAPPSVDSPSIPRSKLKKSEKSTNPKPVKSKPERRKKIVPPQQANTITDYFPIRRSGRQTKSEVALEKQKLLEKLILSDCEDGLKIQEFPNKGRGIVATKDFDAGDFVVEYSGDLLDVPTAKSRELEYTKDPSIGCYMYFFKCGDKTYCVDATAESDRLGRLLNHSRNGNCTTKSLMVNEIPRLILIAKKNIKQGEELSYDYGDRSKEALEAHPWLKL